MKLGKETKETYYKFDCEFSDDECDKLVEYGWREIQKDEAALVNYAVNKLLYNAVEANKTKKGAKNERKTKKNS